MSEEQKKTSKDDAGLQLDAGKFHCVLFVSLLKPIRPSNSQAGLRSRPDLVAVDGSIYDIKRFSEVHPGGAVIAAAGAYDGTALFYSMHAGMKPESSELFQRYKVGTLVQSKNVAEDGWMNESVPKYKYDTPFAKDLLKRVRKELGAKSWFVVCKHILVPFPQRGH